jgi:hypothetical protein
MNTAGKVQDRINLTMPVDLQMKIENITKTTK